MLNLLLSAKFLAMPLGAFTFWLAVTIVAVGFLKICDVFKLKVPEGTAYAPMFPVIMGGFMVCVFLILSAFIPKPETFSERFILSIKWNIYSIPLCAIALCIPAILYGLHRLYIQKIPLAQRLRRSAHKNYGVTLSSPIDQNTIENLRSRSQKELGVEPPKEYLEFLLLSDGVKIANFCIYSSTQYINENIKIPQLSGNHERLAIVGVGTYVESDEVTAYLFFDRKDQLWKIAYGTDFPMPPGDSEIKHSTFDAMVRQVLNDAGADFGR